MIGAYWRVVQTLSAFKSVRCRGCGTPRVVSARQANRAGLCNTCRHPPRIHVTDQHRRFWLSRFTDHEIASLASELVGRAVSPQVVHTNRVLVASGRKQEP